MCAHIHKHTHTHVHRLQTNCKGTHKEEVASRNLLGLFEVEKEEVSLEVDELRLPKWVARTLNVFGCRIKPVLNVKCTPEKDP